MCGCFASSQRKPNPLQSSLFKRTAHSWTLSLYPPPASSSVATCTMTDQPLNESSRSMTTHQSQQRNSDETNDEPAASSSVRDDVPPSAPPEGTATTRISSSQKAKVWALPWVIMILALYAFAVPWTQFAIVKRYFLKPDFEAALPGLGSTPWRKFTMRGHMACGAIALLLGPFQFLSKLRKSFPQIHKWSGRIYCVCAMASCLFGLAFIALKKKLVGGWNMSVAFAMAGITLGVLSFKVWQSARAAKVGSPPMDFTAHRNWGIRSYSQILAPMLYRYWYICVQLFGMYQAPKPQFLGGYCTRDGLCPDYLRLFDKAHCWTYWLTALAVAELIIYYLPKHQIEISEGDAESEQETEVPLLPRSNDGNNGENDRTVLPRAPSSFVDEFADGPFRPIRSASPVAVNTIGWILAVIAIAITTRIYTS